MALPPCCSSTRHRQAHARHIRARAGPRRTAARIRATGRIFSRGDELSPEDGDGIEYTSMPMRTKDLKSWPPISEMNSGVAIEKSDFSMVARRSGPSDARSMRSSVFPRATGRVYDREGGLSDHELNQRQIGGDRRTSRVLLGDDDWDLVDLKRIRWNERQLGTSRRSKDPATAPWLL